MIEQVVQYFLGRTENPCPPEEGLEVMRLMDIMLALPSLLLAVAIVAILGPGLINTVIAIAIVSLPSYVRLTRAAVMGELNRAGLNRVALVSVGEEQ